MALNRSRLETELLRDVFMKRNGNNFLRPAEQFAMVYRRYASTAASCAGANPLPIALDAARAKLAAFLAAELPTSRTPASFVTTYSVGLTGFWLFPPVPFPSAAPGLVTIAFPTPLEIGLLNVIANSIQRGAKNTPALVAHDWAVALDAWTRTVVVTHGPVPACVAPLV